MNSNPTRKERLAAYKLQKQQQKKKAQEDAAAVKKPKTLSQQRKKESRVRQPQIEKENRIMNAELEAEMQHNAYLQMKYINARLDNAFKIQKQKAEQQLYQSYVHLLAELQKHSDAAVEQARIAHQNHMHNCVLELQEPYAHCYTELEEAERRMQHLRNVLPEKLQRYALDQVAYGEDERWAMELHELHGICVELNALMKEHGPSLEEQNDAMETLQANLAKLRVGLENEASRLQDMKLEQLSSWSQSIESFQEQQKYNLL